MGMRHCIVRWPQLATLLIFLAVLVESRKFHIMEERPDYKMLVVDASEQLDKHIVDVAHFVLQLEQLRGLLIWRSYEMLMREKENYLFG